MKRSKFHETDNVDTNEPINKVCTETLCVKETDLADCVLGKDTMYVGSSTPLLHGISSRRTPSGSIFSLINGTCVRVCTRPVIPFDGSSDHSPKVLIHYTVNVKGHASECSCGNCGCTFSLTGDTPKECDCGTEPYDEGKQQCIVM